MRQTNPKSNDQPNPVSGNRAALTPILNANQQYQQQHNSQVQAQIPQRNSRQAHPLQEKHVFIDVQQNKKNISDINNNTNALVNKASMAPSIPRLNLLITPRQSQSLNLNRFGSISAGGFASNSDTRINSNKNRPHIPGLNLEVLDLSMLPPASSKGERHSVYVCLFYTHLKTEEEKEMEIGFNKNMVTFNFFGNEEQNQIIVVEMKNEIENKEVNYNSNNDPNINDSIPSLQTIDLAYQNLDHLPALIDQNTTESSHLTQYIEDTLTEILELRDKRESLKIENAVMQEKIRAAKEERMKFETNAEKLKKDFDMFIAKIPGI